MPQQTPEFCHPELKYPRAVIVMIKGPLHPYCKLCAENNLK